MNSNDNNNDNDNDGNHHSQSTSCDPSETTVSATAISSSLSKDRKLAAIVVSKKSKRHKVPKQGLHSSSNYNAEGMRSGTHYHSNDLNVANDSNPGTLHPVDTAPGTFGGVGGVVFDTIRDIKDKLIGVAVAENDGIASGLNPE